MSKNNNQTVRFKKGKYNFEILTRNGAVKLFKENKLGWGKVLAVEAVFTNAKKGNLARASDLISVFGTDNIDKCAQQIINQGNAQISASQKREAVKKHQREIVAYLNKTYVNKNGLPYSSSQLELFLAEAKIKYTSSMKTDAESLIKKLQGKLVFRKAVQDYTLFIGQEYARKCAKIVYKFSSNFQEKWSREGCKWVLQLTLQECDDLTKHLTKITGGDYQLSTV